MTTSKQMQQTRQKKLYLNFRIDSELLSSLERVQQSEQRQQMYPFPRSAVIIKLLKIGIKQYDSSGPQSGMVNTPRKALPTSHRDRQNSSSFGGKLSGY